MDQFGEFGCSNMAQGADGANCADNDVLGFGKANQSNLSIQYSITFNLRDNVKLHTTYTTFNPLMIEIQ